MTIVPLQKVTLYGMARDREDAVTALQRLGCVHLLPLRRAAPLEVPDAVRRRRADAAFAHLTAAPDQRRPWPAGRSVDLDVLIADALDNKARLRDLRDRIDFLRERIRGLAAFGDFALPPGAALRGRKLWFYTVPLKLRRALQDIDLPWQVVGRGPTVWHVAVLAREEPPADLLPVPRVHTGSRRLSHLHADLADAEIALERAEDAWSELSRSRFVLGLRLAQAQDADARREATAMTLEAGPVFALQGWAPVAATDDLHRLARDTGLAITLAPPGPDDSPPTLLDTADGMPGSDAITTFYRVPAYGAWDPSLIVYASFAVFFAMILADAGYAGVLGGILAFYWRRLGHSGKGRRARVMVAVLLAVAGAYGVAAGSYFGLSPQDGPLARVAFIDVTDVDAMMRVSICIGVAHVSLANAVAARRARGLAQAAVHVGWIVAACGGLALWLVPGPWGGVALATGLAAVVLGQGAARPVVTARDWLWRILAGLQGLTRVSSMFGDVLSYMRLFALGLASASLAATFNGLALDLAGGVPGGGVALAIVVAALGHGINLALGIVSGAVHGLRLNFIEFFGWGLTEEGYPFRAFARREIAP